MFANDNITWAAVFAAASTFVAAMMCVGENIKYPIHHAKSSVALGGAVDLEHSNRSSSSDL
eukprot:13412484-Ditylum_brightwellii.AAC.1